MKKTILCLSLFCGSSYLFRDNCDGSTTRITDVHGGLGVSATVVNAQGHDWEIILKGPFVVLGIVYNSGDYHK